MVDATPFIPVDEEIALGGRKLGHRCCGCCCDTRRAVIILNIITAVLYFLWMGVWIEAVNNPGIEGIDDDQLEQDIVDSYKWSLIINGVGVAFSIAAIIGASLYNIWLVLLGVLWIVTDVILSFMYTDAVAKYHGMFIAWILVWAGLMLYPHVAFIYEVKKGIMTRDTYPREQFSCCCVVGEN